jgi:hypothetical protein
MAVDVGDGLFITPDVIDEEDEANIINLACQLTPAHAKGLLANVSMGSLLQSTTIAAKTLGWDGITSWTPEQYHDRFPDWVSALWWKLVGRGVVPVEVANVLPDQVCMSCAMCADYLQVKVAMHPSRFQVVAMPRHEIGDNLKVPGRRWPSRPQRRSRIPRLHSGPLTTQGRLLDRGSYDELQGCRSRWRCT